MTENDPKYIHYRISVPKEFEDVFSHFYFAENKSDETITKTLLPSFQTILIFSFGENVLLQTQQKSHIIVDKCLVLGPIKKAFDYALPKNSKILVVNFIDDAFYRFFGLSSVMENRPAQLYLLNENCFTAIWHELKKINDTTNRVNYILDFCRPYLRKRNTVAEQLANFKEQALDPIKTIAEMNQKTERTIQIHHKKYFGYSAKEINRYRRFLRAIDLIQQIAINGSKPDWFEIIFECGYYDQSHFIHDFKHYLHLSPMQYLKFQQDICNPMA